MTSVQEAAVAMRTAIADGTYRILSPFPTTTEWADMLETSMSTASKAIGMLVRSEELVKQGSMRQNLVAGPELRRVAGQLLRLAGTYTVGSALPSRADLAVTLRLPAEATGRLLEVLAEQAYLKELDADIFTATAAGRLTGQRFLTRSRAGHYLFCRPRELELGTFGALFYVVATTGSAVALFRASGHGDIEGDVGMSVSSDPRDQRAVRYGSYRATEGAVKLFERGRRQREVSLATVLAPIPVNGIFPDARLAVYLLGPMRSPAKSTWLVYWERNQLTEAEPNGGFALVTCDEVGAIQVGDYHPSGTALSHPIEIFRIRDARPFTQGSLLAIEDAVVSYVGLSEVP